MSHGRLTRRPVPPRKKTCSPMATPNDVIVAGQAAWQRLKRNSHDLDSWIEIGAALRRGREITMQALGVSKPSGGQYVIEYAKWLTKTGFADIHQSTRGYAIVMAEREGEIRRWLAGLKPEKRTRINHPITLYRVFFRPRGTSPQKRVTASNNAAVRQELRHTTQRVNASHAELTHVNQEIMTARAELADLREQINSARSALDGLKVGRPIITEAGVARAVDAARIQLRETGNNPGDAELVTWAALRSLDLALPESATNRTIKRIEGKPVSLARVRALERPPAS